MVKDCTSASHFPINLPDLFNCHSVEILPGCEFTYILMGQIGIIKT